MWQRHRILWFSIAAGWMLIALSFTLNYFFFSRHYVTIFSTPPTLLQMLVWEIPYWVLWAALAPVVFLITRRFPLERDAWLRNAVVHVLAGLALAIAHRVIYLPICWLLYVDVYRKMPSLADLYASDLLFNLPTGLMSYGTFLLVSNVIEYYEQSQAGKLRASQLEAQLAQAQLLALKMQLHPHFLFNTLNGITGLVRDNDNAAAVQMLVGLSELLRQTLDNSGRQEVRLSEELDWLELYLKLQQMRFSDRLRTRIEAEPQVLDALVPNLITQPLVENAIRHGLASRAAPGLLSLSAKRSDGRLELRICDDGAGLPDDWQMETGQGLGLANTLARLRHLFGADFKLEIRNQASGGVEAFLSIPLQVPADASKQ